MRYWFMLLLLLVLAACRTEADMLEVTPEGLPAGARLFYTEEPPDCNHCPVFVLRVDGARFSSENEGDFERLLRHYRWLETDALSAEQVARLYNYMHPSERGVVVDIADLAERTYLPAEVIPLVEPPSVQKNSDGSAVLTFWATDFDGLTKLMVTVQPDYTTETEFEAFADDEG